MDREQVYELLNAKNSLDYETYLDCEKLLSCQKKFEDLCNKDELLFQVVHQVEELWMKLMSYTLLDVAEYLQEGNTPRVLTLMGRSHRILKMMIDQLDLLETMSPKEYQEIRLQLGNGSGQESPGFRTMLKMPPSLWKAYDEVYVTGKGRTIEGIYNSDYSHDDAYVVAESLIEFDELFQLFRWHHIFLIHRSIGMGSASLKGRSVDLLQDGAKHRFFPALWDIRVEMTNSWGGTYGKVRDSIS